MKARKLTLITIFIKKGKRKDFALYGKVGCMFVEIITKKINKKLWENQ